MKLEQQEYSLG